MTFLPGVRYAGRLLARTPLVTMTAVLSLAFGIAGTAAIFSLADALLLRPRPGVADPPTLVDVGRSNFGQGMDNFGYPLFEAMRDGSTMLSAMAAHRFGPEIMSLGDATASERVFASLVSANYFSVVGTKAAIGRFFVAEEDRTPDTHPVVVLSHAFWSRRFAGDPAVIGRTLRLNSRPYTVIGVAEEGFTGTTVLSADFWVPMAMDTHVRGADVSLRNSHDSVWLVALGRLKPGVTVPQAQAELHAIMQAYLTGRGDARAGRWGATVTVSGRVPAPNAGPVIGFVGLLGGLTVLVLLVACSNVAGMLVARGLDRSREFATRLAVGASRARLIRQLLLEGLVLALLAGLASIPITATLVTLLASYQPALPVPLALDLRVDPRVHGVAFVLALFAAIAFSLLPALQSTRVDLMGVLRGASASADRRRAWFRQALVVTQIAIALLLAVAAGLFLRSLQKAAAVDVGFNVANVDTLQIDTRIGGYMTAGEGNRVVEELSARFQRIPGVTNVGASRLVPLQGTRIGLGPLKAPGYTGPDGRPEIDVAWDVVSTDYFRTLEIPILEGRPFDARDRSGAPLAVIVNQTLAGRLWPGQPAVGKTLIHDGDTPGQTLHVVGVARDTKTRTLSDGPTNFVYVPLAQQFRSEVTFYARRAPGPSLMPELRREVAAFDPMLPVVHTETLESATALALLPQRIAAWIAGSVASVGLFLVALGIYGLTAFTVSQRRREIAIRIAVGAPARSVVWLIVQQAARLTAVGATIGLSLGAALAAALQSFLIGVGRLDLTVFAVTAGLLAAVIVGSTWAPARRAARMDPVVSLRAE